MKTGKIPLLFLIFLSISFFSHADDHASAEIDLEKYQGIIVSIIDNLAEIILANPDNEIVYSTFLAAENALKSNQVNIRLDLNLNNVLSGMYFSIHENGEISLVFGLKYLDSWFPESSIHYSILIHEYRHLHDYLRNGQAFVDALNDEKERYWYELDALRVEAEFIKDYLNGNFELSRFEYYLLYSFEDNNLNTISIIFLRESMDVFFFFHNLEMAFVNNEISMEEIIRELPHHADYFMEMFHEADEEFLKAFFYIDISTFRRYLIRTMVLILNSPNMTWGEVFSLYPEIGRVYHEMSEIVNGYFDAQRNYFEHLINIWENDILMRSVVSDSY